MKRNYTREDIMNLVREEDVEFIRLQFTDMFGNLKNVAITSSQLEKALDNLDYHTYEYSLEPEGEKEQGKGYTKQLLGECKYFSATLYEVEDEAELSLDDASFSVIVFLEGTGTMETENRQSPFRPGDSFFVPAGKKVLKIKGKGKFVLSRI